MHFILVKKIESITISNSVKNIGDSAFEWCIKLNNISIPDSVTNIGDKAFGYSYGIYEYCNDSVNWHWHEKNLVSKSPVTQAPLVKNMQNLIGLIMN